ncbi:unnamed protein product (macronuclear) [Paramecium tetraurelia]|uniref:GPI ethanolamine phosphate transferase 3 n=1 Tax=Paramecium tetraurelia TaxID=5888 RepID=A0C960_PARTE|nr:uncharacterized protein GSPATT00006633001 [Paramecium tetraurelia]CAK67327.1 unnamed protein product [Paramecium tetraurelia]|eukprot:XP_001434724.1 hypothetical protein (macronuclear) [Paramecium tetraurelia strain d4-2]
MWNNTSFGILLLELFALSLFLMGYFQVKTTFEDINEVESSNDKPMKIILLLVDALRIDLFANKNFTFYQNMKENQEEYQILYYGISSTPTATQLNLQSITTGNFPAFIDFGSNMAAQELKEDNVIYSMKRNNKKLALLGDDTWFHMFPKSFDYKFVSESFDVRDLDSDDNIIINNIEDLIKENKYDFIVGHLLGIDHSGHSYNDSNQALWNKQQQYSDLLYKIYNQMDNQTILFVVGDHGMSQDGNHGGDSPYEVSSTIYAINKQYKFNKKLFDQAINSQQYINQQLIDRNLYIRQIYSINLAPTISYLMGSSLPYSNMGAILTEMVNTKEQQENSCKENLIQIINYLSKLAKVQGSININLQQYEQNLQSKQFKCQQIQEIIKELQFELKENVKTYDYTLLFLGLSMMVILFAFHILKQSEYLFNKQFSNQQQYIFYRLEFFVLIIPAAILIDLIFSHSSSIKFISFYLILAILKQILQPLTQMQNIRVILTKVISPLPHYRQYFMIFANIITQIGIQVLSVNRQIVSSSNIFGTLLNIFIILFITQFKLIKQIHYVLLALGLLILAEQYNLPQESKKPFSPLTIVSINFIFESFWIKFVLPIIFLQKILYKLNFKIYFYIFLGLAQFIHFYNNCPIFNNILNQIFEGHLRIITIYLPMLLYISSLAMIFIFRDFSYFFLIILTVSGKQGMMIYCCLFYSVHYLTKFYMCIDRAWLPPVAGATIQLMLNYSWFCLGHRMSFSNVKFQDALIGSESFNVVFNTTLLIISIFGVFATINIIKNITLQILVDEQSLQQKFPIQQFNNRIIDFLIIVQFSQVTFAALHNMLNLYHQNIIELFAQRIIYESIIFTIVILVRLFNTIFEKTICQKQYEFYFQPYQKLSNEIKDKNKE